MEIKNNRIKSRINIRTSFKEIFFVSIAIFISIIVISFFSNILINKE